ncbi:MAG: glycosyl hydrolase family 5 [Fibrobacter sp.]|nr:glycosyl hydrolase family 5 [Fibrobacter sp.]
MKFPFFKALVAASAFALICSCGDESPTKTEDSGSKYIVADRSYIFVDSNKNTYLISDKGVVSDTNGTVIGLADSASGLIVYADGTPIATEVDFSKLEVVEPTIILADGWLLNTDQTLIIYQDLIVYDAAGNPIGTFVLNEGTFIGNIYTIDGNLMVKDVDLSALPIVSANVSLPGSSSAGSDDLGTPSSDSNPGSSGSVPKSSSSVAKSSSSSAPPPSSSSADPNGNCPVIKYVNGGASGSGFASRYWDCCKPSCSWNENAGGHLAKQCDAKGNQINDPGSGSICSGGNAATCVSQSPFTIEGCENIGFAFAAVPGSQGGKCGHCYELTFTGEAYYYDGDQKKSSTGTGSKRLKNAGKKLIIMASNIGYDVRNDQFDIMIPGGGYGAFDGCSSRMGWGDQGERYGGLLSQCEIANNYAYVKAKNCLIEKCNSNFGSDKVAKEGCLFLANFLEATSNPAHTFKEVECPEVLKNKY